MLFVMLLETNTLQLIYKTKYRIVITNALVADLWKQNDIQEVKRKLCIEIVLYDLLNFLQFIIINPFESIVDCPDMIRGCANRL